MERVFTAVDEEVTDDHLKQLTYLDLVIKESLRLWPTFPHIARCPSEDIEIGELFNVCNLLNDILVFHAGGYTIPARTNVLIPVIHVHRDKALWGQDANDFKPERFKPENFEKIHPYAYLPFSKGPRSCIGSKYAANSLKVVLSHFFRRFKVSTTLKMEELEFEYSINIQLHQGCIVTLEKRQLASTV
jgi:cytochrome P450